MDFRLLVVFLGTSILSSVASKNSAIGLIERLGTHLPRYPKGYIDPAKWVRRLFKIKQRLIPRYLYIGLFMSLFYAILGPINLTICAFTNYNPDIAGILIMVHVCLVIFETIFLAIATFFAKRHKASG